MKAVILAAGRGKRLYPYTKYIPKCLLDVGGETILEQQINNIRDCGIDEVVIVVGFGFEKVENFLRNYDGLGMRIKTLYNPFYQTTNSLISLWIARGEMDQDIVVMNGDDVFEIDVLEQALNQREERICLPIKVKSSYEEEDMKVYVKGRTIIEIGKTLANRSSAESVGIRVFRDTGVEFIKRAIEEEMRIDGAEKKWYISAIHRLIKKGYKVKSLDINDLFWMDVDYPSDLFKARFNSCKFLTKPRPERILRVVESN
ncbi:MAG: sugar phosphate nucleotidyltransferase [Thermodesulfobacteriota bacterium]|jgi:choline kinase